MGEQPTDGDFQDALEWARLQLTEWGFFKTRDGLRWATAYGLVRSVWRNGPIENAHASRPTSRREALHDGTMFARDTWFTRQAFDVLGSDDQFRLYELEDLVLDRDQVWPGCEGPVHPWFGFRDDHYGMPRWPACVEAAACRLRGEDEEFWRWCPPEVLCQVGRQHERAGGRRHRPPRADHATAAARSWSRTRPRRPAPARRTPSREELWTAAWPGSRNGGLCRCGAGFRCGSLRAPRRPRRRGDDDQPCASGVTRTSRTPDRPALSPLESFSREVGRGPRRLRGGPGPPR